jgi:hypothetical protein
LLASSGYLERFRLIHATIPGGGETPKGTRFKRISVLSSRLAPTTSVTASATSVTTRMRSVERRTHPWSRPLRSTALVFVRNATQAGAELEHTARSSVMVLTAISVEPSKTIASTPPGIRL